MKELREAAQQAQWGLTRAAEHLVGAGAMHHTIGDARHCSDLIRAALDAPRDETALKEWTERAADAGIKACWAAQKKTGADFVATVDLDAVVARLMGVTDES